MDFVQVNDSGSGEWYAPEFAGNRDKDPEKQAAIRIVEASARAVKRAETAARASGVKKKSQDLWTSVIETSDQANIKIIRDHVKELRNFWRVLPDGRREEIKTVDDLIEAVGGSEPKNSELLIEIGNAIVDRSRLEEGLIPNFG